jgi:hypothetical protein
MCDGDHFAPPSSAVGLGMVRRTNIPLEVKMARVVKKTRTRLALWIDAFRKSRYYDTIE